jgi:hypothetical protein
VCESRYNAKAKQIKPIKQWVNSAYEVRVLWMCPCWV